MEKFILPNPAKRKGQSASLQIRVKSEAYARLCEMADTSRLSVTEVASRAVNYAYRNLEWEEGNE